MDYLPWSTVESASPLRSYSLLPFGAPGGRFSAVILVGATVYVAEHAPDGRRGFTRASFRHRHNGLSFRSQ